jgi:hypothetical protein
MRSPQTPAGLRLVSFASQLPFLAALLALTAATEAKPMPADFVFLSDSPELNQAYQKARRDISNDVRDGRFLAGEKWAQTWTRDTSFSVDLACALLHPDVSKRTLLGLRDRVSGIGECWAQDRCDHFGGWPSLSDSIVGTSGAWSLYLVTGDRELLRPIFARTVNSLKRAERDAFSVDAGLFGGVGFMDSNSGYPERYAMSGPKIAKIRVLSTNVLYYRGYVIAARLAQLLGEGPSPWRAKAAALKRAINGRLWQPAKGYYAYFLDEDGRLDERMEGCGEAFAILYGVADADKARSILARTPTSANGFPCLWPQYPEWMPYPYDVCFYHDGMIWPFAQGYWAWAAGRAGNAVIFGRELEALIKLSKNGDTFQEFYFPENGAAGGGRRQLWSAAGFISMVYHGLFGMEFEENGIRFSPVVPEQVNELLLTDVNYRNCTFSVSVKGHGVSISRFELDGTDAPAFLDASLTGSHRIDITMSAASN